MTEKYCQQLRTEELGKDTEPLNVMLKESLGGLPKKAWDGLVSPIYCYRIRDYAAALCTNDLDQIREKRKEKEFFFGSRDLYNRVRSLEEVAFNDETGICPEQIYKDFSWMRETDWFQNKLLALIALVEIMEHHAQYGSYPMGEYTEKLPADYTPEYHRFYIVKTDELSIPVIHWEDETTTKTISKDIPERYHLIDLQNTDRFYLSNYDYSPGIKELVIDPAIHQRLKQETTNQQRIQWTFSYWDEAEPILRDILVDQRPRKTGESH